MGNSWEYKVMTLKKASSGFISFINVPDDDEATSVINREGSQGWELVNAVSVAPTAPLKLFFKRPR